MATRLLIESMAAFEAALPGTGPDAVWLTTSPPLLRRLPGMGASVHSLEEGLDHGLTDSLARAAFAVSEQLGTLLEPWCPWRGYVDLDAVFGMQWSQVFFATMYKAVLLEKALGGGPLTVVGDPAGLKAVGLNLNYGRLDTLYAVLAARLGRGDVTVMEHRLDESVAREVEARVARPGMGLAEKGLSLLNNTVGSFCFKTWKNLAARRLWPTRRVSLWPVARRRVWLFKDCEMIEESFLGLLLSGASVGRLGALPQAPDSQEPFWGPGREEFLAAVRDLVGRCLAAEGLETAPAVDVAVTLAAERAALALGCLRDNLDDLTAGFEKTLAPVRAKDVILTNSLNTPAQRIFNCFCRHRGIEVAACDHGVTLGLTEWSRYFCRHFGMAQAATGVYHLPEGAAEAREFAPDQRQVVVGVPRVTLKPPMAGLQRRLARSWLGIGSDEHVVMFAANLDRNNAVYGPGNENDLHFLQSTEAVVDALCVAWPASTVMLKLYPSQRYADSWRFEDLAARLPNLRIVKDMDFRFIRSAADVIVTGSSQSTLGWCLGSQRPVVFLEFHCMPARLGRELGGLAMGDLGIPQVSEAWLLGHAHPALRPTDYRPLYRAILKPGEAV